MKLLAPLTLAALALGAPSAFAHFQEVLPSTQIVEDNKAKDIMLSLVFTHPMEGRPVMNMGPPTAFGVIGEEGKRTDLLSALKIHKVDGKQAYEAAFKLGGPANYIFYLDPAPYWEAEEKKMLVHHTKVVVNGFGADEGWDELTGQTVEIRPLTRPFGLWTGNSFNGVVLYHGKPAPFARVEIEYKNDAHIKAPSDAYVTQVVKTNAAGEFTYTIPHAGWWGFAALITGAEKMAAPTGETVDMEEGGLLWVQTRDMK